MARTTASNRSIVTSTTPLTKEMLSSLFTTANNADVCDFGNILLSNTKVTVAIWVNFRSNSSSNYDVFFGYKGTGRWFLIRIGSGNRVSFNFRSGGSEKASGYPTKTLDFNKWYLVIGTHDPDGGSNNTTMRIYNRDGSLFDSASNTNAFSIDSTANSLFIGRDSNRNTSCNARFDEARIYSEILTVEQQNNLALNIEPPTDNLIGYWKFDEGSGTNAEDSSSGGNDGTLSGAAVGFSTEVPYIGRSSASNRSPAGGVFSPVDISGLKLWFKADALSLSDLDTVSSWTDSSPNANHLVAVSSPVYRTNQINGLPAIVFSNDFMETASISMSQWTTFMVFTPGGSNMYVLSWGPSGSEGRHFISGFVSNTAEYYNSPRISLGSTVNGTWSIHSAKISGSDTTTYKNGVQVATSGTVASDGAGIFRAGNYASGGANPFTGSIAEIIVYENALSSGDLDDVHNYLAEKYGIS